MAVQQHAIAPGARRAGFWPSIAVASAQLRHNGSHRSGEDSLEILRSPGSPRPTNGDRRTPEVCDETSWSTTVATGARAHLGGPPIARALGRAQRVRGRVARCGGRGLGSLVTLGAKGELAGTEVRGGASEHGTNAQRSAHARLRIARRAGSLTAARRQCRTAQAERDTRLDERRERTRRPGAKSPPRTATARLGPVRRQRRRSRARHRGPSAKSSTLARAVRDRWQHGTEPRASAGSDGVIDSTPMARCRWWRRPAASVEVTDPKGSSSGVGVGVPGSGWAIP